MDSFELNKVAGAVLGTLLFAFGTGFVAELIYHPKPAGSAGYALPEPGGGEGGQGGGEAAAPKADSIATRLASADAEKGKAGTKACQACHSFEKDGPNKIGPALWEVVGRKKGSHEGFDYSAGLKEKGGEWTYEDLDHFLENPKGYIKGTKMAFQGIGDPKERANVILYLHTLAESPKPLPEAEKAEGKPAEGDKKQEGKAEGKGDAKTAEGGADAFTAKVAAADPAKGKDGTKACQACHSFEKGGPNKVGPDLWGVVGRKKAGHEGFDYSAALKEKGGEWTLADLNAFLTKPAEYAKGTKMAFQGISQEDKRAEVIAYLNTLADNPKPLGGGDKKDGAAKPEGKTDDAKADEGKKAEGAKPEQGKSEESKAEQSTPAEAKPAGAKPAGAKPAEAKPEDTPPGGGQKDDPKGEAARPAQGESADTDRPGGSGKAESQGTTGENPPEAKPSGGASDAAPKSGDTPAATEAPSQADPSAEKKVEEQKDGGTGELKPQ